MAKQLYTAVYIDNRRYNEGQHFAKYFGAEDLEEAETLARQYESSLRGAIYLMAIRTPNEVVRYDNNK